MNVVVAGGGTAGHVNPAIALARALDGDTVTFLGTSVGAEATLVPQAGFPLETLDVRGFDRARPLSLPATGLRALGAVRVARRLLKRIAPRVVVGMGGYVSLPACLAARSLRIPVVLHEQNIVFGLANRVSKPLAKKVCVSFEDSLAEAGSKGVFVGNPVMPELVSFDAARERELGHARFELEPTRSTLLIFGGSQGAQRINAAAAELATLWVDRSDVQIVHIVGTKQKPSAPTEGGALIYREVPFVDRMIEAYAAADLCVCRGGATTVAELGVVGLPAIIVPYPYHRDRQQERHGRVLERAGAAVVLADSDTTGTRLGREVERLLGDRSRLTSMKEATVALGRPDAATRLAAVVREVAA